MMAERKLFYVCFLFITIVIFSNNIYAQTYGDTVCAIQVDQDDMGICPGECVDLSAAGSCPNNLMYNDFEDGTLGDGWAANCSPMFNNPCGSPPPGSNIYAWIGDASNFPRDLVTEIFDVTDACEICFDLRFAYQGESTPCEGPDEVDEGVSLQYSPDGGTTWHDIVYFHPDGSQHPSNIWVGESTSPVSSGEETNFTTWGNYCFDVPAGAVGTNTRFRWHQEQVTNNTYDHWGIDNVLIACPSPDEIITWYEGSSTTPFDSTTNPPPVCPDVTTTYTVQIEDPEIGAPSITTDDITVTVYDPPPVSIDGPTEVCDSDTPVTLDAGSGMSSYSWNISSTDQTIEVNTSGDYSVTVTDSNGCTNEDEINLTVNPSPTVDLGPDQEHCDYDLPITLDAGTGFASYEWSTGETSQTIDVSTTDTYEVTVTNNQSCTASDTVEIVIHNAPSPDLGGDYSLCDYDVPLSLDAGSAGDTYNWSTGDSGQVIDVTTSDLYSVTVTDEYGCSGEDESQVTVNPSPTPDLGEDIDVCNYNLPITLDPNTDAGYNYSWSNGESTPTIDVDQSGTYMVTVEDDGCFGVDTIDVAIHDSPEPDLGEDIIECEYNTPVILDAGSGTSFSWSNGNTSQTINVSSSNVYTVTVTNEHGCTGEDEMELTINPDLYPDAGENTLICSYDYTLDGSSASSGTQGTWEQLDGPVVANFANENDPNTTVTVNMDGVYEFIWRVEYLDGSGCWASDTVKVEFYEMLDPTITDVPDMCVSESAVVLEIEDVGTVTSNPDINTEIENGIIDPSGLDPGVYTIINEVDGPCVVSDQDDMTFEIYDEIEVIDFVDQECNGVNTEYYTEWSVVGWDGTPTTDYFVNGVAQSSSDFSEAHPSATNYSYTVTDGNGCSSIELDGYRDCGCPSPGTMSSLSLKVLCEGTCTGDSVFHNGDEIMDGASLFEFFIHAGDEVPLAYNSEPDFCRPDFGGDFNVTYYVSAVTGFDEDASGHVDVGESCYSIAQGTPVMWRENPNADAGPERDTCGLVLPVTGNEVPVGMVGYWSSECNYTPVQGTNNNDNEMVVLTDDYGDCTFTWHIANGQCVGEDDVVMHFNQTPAPYAGNDTIVCGNEVELNVDHSIPGSTLQWSGNANFNPQTGPNPTITVSNYGVYYFTLTESNASCYNDDEIKVTFVPGPHPTIQNQVDTVCGLQYILNAQNVNGSGVWTAYEDGTEIYPTFENDTMASTEVTINGLTGEYRTVEFVWTETNSYQSVQCTNDVSCEITFAANVYAQAGIQDQLEACGSQVTFNADTTGMSPATGNWISPVVAGTFDDNTIPDATFTMTSMGSYGDSAHVTYPVIWKVGNGGCQMLDTVHVTMYKKPNANGGNDDVVCGLQYDLEAYYNLPETNGYSPYGYWYAVSDSNPGTASFAEYENPETIVNVSQHGEYYFVWRENNSIRPNCNDRDTVIITFKEKPVISAGDDFDVCGKHTQMNAVSAGFDGQWLSEPGVGYDDDNNPNTEMDYVSYGSVDLVWQESNDECTSQDTVTVTFWRKPDAQLAIDPEDTAVCGRKFNLRAENPGSDINGNWIAEPSNSVDFYFQEHNDTVEVTYYGHYDFFWVLSNHPDNEPPTFCSDTTDPWTVHFIEVPQANAGNDTLFCGLTGELNAQLSIDSASGQWSNLSGNIIFYNGGDPNTTVESLVYTEGNPNYEYFTLEWTEDNYGCTDTDEVQVRFAKIPSAQISIIPPMCFGYMAGLTASENNHTEYIWTTPGGITDSIFDPAYDNSGYYRRLVHWENGDTVHPVSLQVVSQFGCYSAINDTFVNEPDIPDYELNVHPDTCLLDKGGINFIPDTSTMVGFRWIDVLNLDISDPTDTVQRNIPAGTYRVSTIYETMNQEYVTEYEMMYDNTVCRDTFEITINTVGMIKADFEIAADIDVDALVAPEATVWFNNLSDGDELRTSNVWYFDDGESETNNDEQVEHIYTEPNDCYEPYLIVYARNLPECRDTAFMDCIKVDDRSNLEVPNIFTPNGDGMNDFFQVKAQTLRSFHGKIVNRWGRTIFEWNNYEDEEAGWDGKISSGNYASNGVYYYIIKAEGVDGYEYDLQGPFHLIKTK